MLLWFMAFAFLPQILLVFPVTWGIYLIRNLVTKYSTEHIFPPVSKIHTAPPRICTSSHFVPPSFPMGMMNFFKVFVIYLWIAKLGRLELEYRDDPIQDLKKKAWHDMSQTARVDLFSKFPSLSQPQDKLICDTRGGY